MMEDNSAFFVHPETPSAKEAPAPELIHSSRQGFCELYRVDRMGQFRVLKCLKTSFRGDPLYENLLRKEFEIGYTLRHPNICEYYSFGPQEGLGNCIEMEWVDGRTLETLLSEGRPVLALRDKILDELCDALTYIHSKQILHRDLKPSNILITYGGDTVKLVDFGFSDSDAHTVLKTPAGTQAFAAPETLRDGIADIRSDIFSLGLIISALGGHRDVARKCCEKLPQHRYPSVSAVKKALHSRSPLLAGIIFILLIVLATMIPSLNRIRTPKADMPATDERVQDTVSRPDTTLPLPPKEDTQASGKQGSETKAGQQPRPKEKEEDVDPSVIDELFRQATELFN